jgi:GMP synthase (glutamine-hydrolysing)
MPILVLQHWNSGGPGRFGVTLRDHGFSLDIRRPDLPLEKGGRPVPTTLEDLDGLVILGGPQNVTDIARYPWMQAEAALVQKAHAANKPIIGICLGAQLIGHALGGQVEPRPAPALGFYPMSLTTAGQLDTIMAGVAWNHPQLFSCGQAVTRLPPDSTLLAGTTLTPRQEFNVGVFKVGLRTYAFQCHPECDREMTDVLFKCGMDDAGRLNLTLADLLAQADREYPMFARQSDRLAVNLATYLFPSSGRMRV